MASTTSWRFSIYISPPLHGINTGNHASVAIVEVTIHDDRLLTFYRILLAIYGRIFADPSFGACVQYAIGRAFERPGIAQAGKNHALSKP
jgi:hypothetical protein